MTGEREIDYEALVQEAMRGVVRVVLMRVAKSGLPGEHHFYIAFRTDAPGVGLSKRLKEKYPEEMTVVLQHRFWDLIVSEDRFEVKLTFDSIPERLLVPFDAIKVFFDPSVPYGLQFEDFDIAGATAQAEGQGAKDATRATGPEKAADTATVRTEKKPRAGRRTQSEKAAERAPATAPDKTPAKSSPVTGKPAGVAPATGQTPGQTPGQTKVVSIDSFRKK